MKRAVDKMRYKNEAKEMHIVLECGHFVVNKSMGPKAVGTITHVECKECDKK